MLFVSWSIVIIFFFHFFVACFFHSLSMFTMTLMSSSTKYKRGPLPGSFSCLLFRLLLSSYVWVTLTASLHVGTERISYVRGRAFQCLATSFETWGWENFRFHLVFHFQDSVNVGWILIVLLLFYLGSLLWWPLSWLVQVEDPGAVSPRRPSRQASALEAPSLPKCRLPLIPSILCFFPWHCISDIFTSGHSFIPDPGVNKRKPLASGGECLKDSGLPRPHQESNSSTSVEHLCPRPR